MTARTTLCLNCGAQLGGQFCGSCGQRDIPPYPSVRELAIDAALEFSGWDGRLASTLRALVLRPGMLTREFLEGRRARYISPLRLYLTASLAYFVLSAAAPNVRLPSGKSGGLNVTLTPTDSQSSARGPERVAKVASEALSNPEALSPAEKQGALDDIKRAPAFMQPFLRRGIEDPGGIKRGILETMPRMLFALLPIFAGIVALFYHGRKYPEHLYFAIHLHAFIFLALAVAALAKFTRSPILVAVAGLTVAIWIPIYATLAFRRLYGGSLIRTLVKETGIGAIYAVAAGIAFLILIYWVSIAG
jgi:hypothetical protein